MAIKISVDDLVPGMYIVEFCGSWIDHPFWRGSFVITEPQDIARVRASRIREVWIDPDQRRIAPTANANAVVQTISTAPAYRAEPIAERSSIARSCHVEPRQMQAPTAVPIAEELGRAAQLCTDATVAVESLFLQARLGKALDTVAARQLVNDIADSVTRNRVALISLTRLKTADNYTFMHSVAVCAMMIALAGKLGHDAVSIRVAGMAGLLHDVGKAQVPREILQMAGSLTAAQFAVVKRHPEVGHQMLRDNGQIDPRVLEVCLQHHEKADGSGYPQGLDGAHTGLWAKMGAVCDIYDAITSNRPYKTGADPAEAMRQMGEWTKTQIDPDVFYAFASCLGIYPVGALVKLRSGRVGVVTDQTAKSPARPLVKTFYCCRSRRRVASELVDLSAPDCDDAITACDEACRQDFPDLDQLWSGIAAPNLPINL